MKPPFDALTPEDFFGLNVTQEQVRDQFTALRRKTHPDTAIPEYADQAEAYFNSLTNYYEEAVARFNQGIYGDREALTTPIIVPTKNHGDYELTHRCHPVPGAHYNYYYGKSVADKKSIFLKAVGSPVDNDLFDREYSALRKCYSSPLYSTSPTAQLLPKLTATFFNRSHAGIQAVHVFEKWKDPGFTLVKVKERYGPNLPLEHIVWIINRCISALEIPHAEGLVYAGFVPENVMIYPANHGATLWNWEYSVPSGKSLKILAPTQSNVHYPSYATDKKTVFARLDLAMLVKLFYYLADIDSISGELPKKWYTQHNSAKQQIGLRHLTGFMRYYHDTDAIVRVQEFHAEFRTVVDEIFGARKFVPFEMK